MNSPFVLEQARSLAQRVETSSAATAPKNSEPPRLVFQRPAARSEVQLGEKFIAAQAKTTAKVSPLEKYAQILLLSNELIFVD